MNIWYEKYEKVLRNEINPLYPKYGEKISEVEKKKRIDEHNEKRSAIIEKWKAELFKKYGVSNHPKVNKLWDLAYEYGHANGCGEIESYFDELVELIKD